MGFNDTKFGSNSSFQGKNLLGFDKIELYRQRCFIELVLNLIEREENWWQV